MALTFGKRSIAVTPELQTMLSNRIKQIELENKYYNDFFSSEGTEAEAKAKSMDMTETTQDGVTIPRYYGLLNSFIVNPSNVSIGVIDRIIKTDDTALCAVHFKATMMLSKIGEYENDNKEIEDFVRGFLTKLKRPNWKQSLQAQASKGGYGFSITEYTAGLNKKNQKVPMRAKTYHPSTICFEADPWGEITEWGIVQFIIQNSQISNPNQYFPFMEYGFKVDNPFETPLDRLLPYRMAFINNYGLTRIWKHKVIHHVENDMLSFGNPYGTSAVRTAHLAWQMKVYVMKQLGIATKRNATPFIHATAPLNKNKTKFLNPRTQRYEENNPVENIRKILAQRQSDDSIVTGPETEGYKITAILNQCDLEQLIDVLKFLNTMIFRAFVIPSLVVTDGEGSRSLGEKQFEIVDQMASEDAEGFGDNIVEQMIRRTVIENYGEQDNYGKFKKKPLSLAEKKELSDLFCNLANAGWMSPLDKEQGDHVASVLDIPERGADFYLNPNINADGTPVISEDTNNPGKETPPNEPEK